MDDSSGPAARVGRAIAVAQRRWLLLLVLALFAALVACVTYRQSRVVLAVDVVSDTAGRLQLFHDAAGRFSEDASTWIPLVAGESRRITLRFHGDDATYLRLDPPIAARISVCNLGIDGTRSTLLARAFGTKGLTASADGSCVQLQAQSSASDPQAVLRLEGAALQRSRSAGRWWLVAAISLLLAFATMALALRAGLRQHRLRTDMAIVWMGRADAHAHRLLACLMLVFGIGYLLLTPPGAVPDEAAHLAKIVRISEGVPFGDSAGSSMPHIASYGKFGHLLGDKAAFTARDVIDVAAQPLRCEAADARLPRQANGYFPHQYLLSAGVLSVTCALHGTFGEFLYLSRLLNLLLATALSVFGVYHAVRGKWALLLVSLLPMSLFETASISADSLTLAMAIAWLGVVSGIHGGSLTPRRAVPWLYVLGFGIALSKGGNLWMLVALGFCRQAFDRDGVPFWPALGKFVLLPWLAGLAWALHAAPMLTIRDGVDHAANALALANDPIGFAQMLLATFQERGAWLVRSMIGVLGWLDVALPMRIYVMATVVLVLSLWANGSDRLPNTIRLPALGLGLASLPLIAIPLYLYWTPTGSAVIEGLQGRYFLSTLAFVLVWCSFRSNPQVRVGCIVVIVAGALWMNLAALQTLHVDYFVTGRPG